MIQKIVKQSLELSREESIGACMWEYLVENNEVPYKEAFERAHLGESRVIVEF